MTTPRSTPRPSERSVLGRVRVSYPRLHRILVPLDFSGKSRQALRYALPIAQRFSARIVLLHVLPAKATTAQRLKARLRLDDMAARLLPPPLQGENLVQVGSAARQILEAANKQDIDLVVIATKGRSGLRGLLRGSTAEQVMRLAQCPVLSLRRR